MSNLREITEGLPKRINVLNEGGVVAGKFKSEGDIKSNRYLTGPTFVSTCSLPDVRPNTKIVGICGITDYNDENDPKLPGLASPKEDGWFFSDFYLFHHLLKPVSSDQRWLSCVDPRIAVTKYGRYVHGDSSPGKIGTRRVVLDHSMLGEVRDLEVIQPSELKGCAFDAIRDACQQACEQNRPLLILIFSHGVPNYHDIILGGDNPLQPNKLSMDMFKQAIGQNMPKEGLCLLTTACYSGRWAINPNLNISTLTAQADWIESLAWPVSGTINKQSCGSPFVSAIAEMLVKLTIRGYKSDEVDDFGRSPTYAGLISQVKKVVGEIDSRKQTVSSGGNSYLVHQPMFSAQDDEWELAYSKRTGFPVNLFKQRWLQLKAAGARQEPPGGGHSFGPGGRVFSRDQLVATIRREAKAYLDSKPGTDNKGNNLPLHNALRNFLDGSDIPLIGRLANLRNQVDYRLYQIMGAATNYKKYWGLNQPDCHEVDVETSPGVGSDRWRELLRLVGTYPLFDAPSIFGHRYEKGAWYITCCIYNEGWDNGLAKAKLRNLLHYKDEEVPGSGVPVVAGSSRVMSIINQLDLNKCPTIRDSLRDIAQKTKRSIRNLSPRKSNRAPLPKEWMGGSPGAGTSSPGLAAEGPSR